MKTCVLVAWTWFHLKDGCGPCHDCCAEAGAVPEALDDDIQEAVVLSSGVVQSCCSLSDAGWLLLL